MFSLQECSFVFPLVGLNFKDRLCCRGCAFSVVHLCLVFCQSCDKSLPSLFNNSLSSAKEQKAILAGFELTPSQQSQARLANLRTMLLNSSAYFLCLCLPPYLLYKLFIFCYSWMWVMCTYAMRMLSPTQPVRLLLAWSLKSLVHRVQILTG